MTFHWPWSRSKSIGSQPAAGGATAVEGISAARATSADVSVTAPSIESKLRIRNQIMPSPALRWVAEGRIALRSMVFDSDGDAICSFQEETYRLNFPEFRYTAAFAEAFRYDLRRAALDFNHGIFVLDDGRETPGKQVGNIAGFLWVVMAQNNWSGDRYGYINNLYVAPARRGQGLGRELMKQSDEFFRSRGIKRVRLTVTAENEAAVALYRAAGYQVDRWEMEKEL